MRNQVVQWKLKAAAFRMLEAIPSGDKLHFLAQRCITRNWPRKDEDIRLMIELARTFIDDYVQLGGVAPDKATFLEIGAGRDLSVPLSLRMLGVARVITTDIEALAKLDLVNHAAGRIAHMLGVASPRFADWRDLRAFGIDYRAPIDLREASDIGPVDAFISNEVLEHIPADQLPGVLSSVHRFMRPGAVSIHSIDYSDHYARGSSVSRYNFLQYDDRQWARYNSRFQFVNRLRHGQYVELFLATGFDVRLEKKVEGEIPEDLLARIAPPFLRFPIEELRVKSGKIIAIRK
jgi:hypothetical protein